MAQGMQQAPAGRPNRAGNFNAATRQTLINLPTQAYPGSASQITRLDLPQTGFFAGVWLLLSGNIQTGAAASTIQATYPVVPFGLLRRLRVYNNQNVELWNTSGYGAYIYDRTLRTGLDQAFQYSNVIPTSAILGNVTNPFARYYQNPGDLAPSATGNFAGALFVPVVWGAPLTHGLQMAQDPAIRYSLEITWGDLSDLTITSATSGTPTLNSVQVTPVVELYQVPEEGIDFPNLAFTKTVLEDIQTITTGTGDTTYNFVTGNVLTRLIHELSNQVTFRSQASTRVPIDPNKITQLQLQYAQTQKPYVINTDVQLFRQRFIYGSDLPAGVYCHELCACGADLPELPMTRDSLNTSRLTDLQSIITLSGASTTGAQLRTIREQLVANR